VITEGARGAFVATPEGSFAINPPEAEVISPIGGGDAFAGAALLALSRGEPVEEACRQGSAAAAAAVGTIGTQPPGREAFERILARVRSQALS
jgi:sugar/nucleoside kinase (ribokinase family)